MDREALQFPVLLLPFVFLIIFVLSIILFVNRKKIVAKYDVGYISSFFFAAYMLTPFTLGIPALFSNSDEKTFSLIMSLVYPIVGVIVFMLIYRKKPLQYKLGKFFAMIGLGLCSAWIVVFKMLTFFHRYESARDGVPMMSSGSNVNVSVFSKGKSFYDADGIYRGHMNEAGELYDENSRYQGHINEQGEFYDADGKYASRINECGEIYGSNGEYHGRVNEQGEHYNADGKYIGHSNKF